MITVERNPPMISSAIFLCLFLPLLSMLRKKPWLSIILFLVTLTFTMLLFKHHVTDPLDISL